MATLVHWYTGVAEICSARGRGARGVRVSPRRATRTRRARTRRPWSSAPRRRVVLCAGLSVRWQRCGSLVHRGCRGLQRTGSRRSRRARQSAQSHSHQARTNAPSGSSSATNSDRSGMTSKTNCLTQSIYSSIVKHCRRPSLSNVLLNRCLYSDSDMELLNISDSTLSAQMSPAYRIAYGRNSKTNYQLGCAF